MTYKPVGIDENSLFPPRVEQRLEEQFAPITGMPKSYVGLGNVDNTSDVDKPVSDATKELVDTLSNTQIDGVRNLLEFPGSNPTTRIHDAIAEISSTKGEFILQITEDLTITETIRPDLRYVSLDFTGHTIDASAITNAPAIEFVNTSSEITGMNRRFFKNLVLKGPGKTSVGSVGIRYYSSDATNVKNIRGMQTSNIEIRDFKRGMSMGKNSYLLTFTNGHTYQCGTCLHIEDKDDPTVGSNSNYGENYRFFGWGFGSSDLGIYMGTNDLTDVHMFAPSFDFLQKMATVNTGQLHLFGSHMEFDGALPGPVITAGDHYSAKINISGGRLQHNNSVAANISTWFESLNPYWGGGISLDNIQMHYIFSTSGFLCSGPGRFATSNTSYPSGTLGSGFAMGNVLSSKTNNLLFDPGFAQATHIDAKISVGALTTAVNSPDVDITNSGGKWILTKKTESVGSEVSFYVPVVRDRYYASGFMLQSFTGAGGTLAQNEQYAACNDMDTYGRPKVLRTSSRGSASWVVSTLPNVYKSFGPAYIGGGPAWNRQAPSWANYFIVKFIITDLKIGTYTFSEVAITDI